MQCKSQILKDMKSLKSLVVVLLVLLMSSEVMAMGHPHNLFAARKQLKAKRATATAAVSPSCNPVNPMKVCNSWVKAACLQLTAVI